MQPDEQGSGDYGYDLVHEDVAPRRVPPPEPPRDPRDTRASGSWDERQKTSTDYSYDEAHGM